MLLDLLRVGHFVVRIVSYLLDLGYLSGGLASVGRWQRTVWHWQKIWLASRFGVELYVPWDAPEAVVDISSEGVVPLRHIPDVIGLVGRREGAAESRVLQGRDVPDPRGMDQNFHDVMIVDMGDVPESSISIPELSTLSHQWPPVVISHMGWRQHELEGMHAAAKQRFRQSRPSSCVYCGIWIKCDMYRHVARFHLDLAQLWRCPVLWCTVWKGTPQDCMDHIRGVGGGRMMFRGKSSRPAWKTFFCSGQLHVGCGRTL